MSTSQTPLWVWQWLFLQHPEFREGSVLDPSCGQGDMLSYLKANFTGNLWGFDLDKGLLPAWANNPILSPIFQRRMFVTDFLKYEFRDLKHHSIITEPPPLLAVPFIVKSLNLLYTGGHVVFLLNMNWVTKQGQAEWLRKQPLKTVLKLTQHPGPLCSQTSDFDDLDEYAFFVFQKGYTGQPNFQWLGPPHDIQIPVRKPFRFRFGQACNLKTR